MAPISTKKEQERSILYSSHGISASKFNTDEIRRHPALTLEALERKRENEKKKESAPGQQKTTHPTKNSGPAKVPRISGEFKPQPDATRSSPPDAAHADSAHGSTLKNDGLMLPDGFELLSTTKSKCLDPLDELCKALRVPYTVLDVSAGPRQAQSPTAKRFNRRDEVDDSLDPNLQNFEKATSEKNGDDYEASIKEIGPDDHSLTPEFWDSYYPLISVLAGVVIVMLLLLVGVCCDICCGVIYKKQSQKKKAKADAEQRRELAMRPGFIGPAIGLENANQEFTDPVQAHVNDSRSVQTYEPRSESPYHYDRRSSISANSIQTLPLYKP